MKNDKFSNFDVGEEMLNDTVFCRKNRESDEFSLIFLGAELSGP